MKTKNTKFIHLYIKISISFLFLSISHLGLRLACRARVRAVESVAKVCTSTENTSMQRDKPSQIQVQTVGIQTRL